MGNKTVKSYSIPYEVAVKRVNEAELKRLKAAFKRASNLHGLISKQAFLKEVLGEFVPVKLAEDAMLRQLSGNTLEFMMSAESLFFHCCFIFSLFANEAGTHVVKEDLVKMVQACDGGFVSEAVANCFVENEKVTFEEFQVWLLHNADASTLTQWLMCKPDPLNLSNNYETPTFYQTLAGVTHLEESDIIELEKCYWLLKTQSKTGKFDLETLVLLISPPVPLSLCEGVFNAFDENRDGHIDFKEMACGISACCRGPLVERQKFLFKVFDEDRDGILSSEEISRMVEALLYFREENMTAANEKTQDHETKISNNLQDLSLNKISQVTLDEYLVWSVDQTLPHQFLNILFQICHVVFGLRPTTKEEEGEIIREWLDREVNRGMQIGQFWYLISMEWWKTWNDYIDYQGSLDCGVNTNSMKRTPKMQKKVENSVACSPLEDAGGNVVLSSIISLAEDAISVFQSDSTLTLPESERTTPGHSPVPSRKLYMSSASQRPPAIDNSSLIVPNMSKTIILTSEGGKLRTNAILTRGRDFELVPEAIWRALSQWFGGSPALPRQVIQPSNSDVPELELYPITLKLYRHQAVTNSWSGVVACNNSTFYQSPTVPKRYLAYLASFSRMSVLKQVFDFLCTRLRLRQEDTRLWLYKDDNNLILLEEENLTLEALGIEDNEQILIEVRNKDQTWPEEICRLVNSKIDQKNKRPAERGATGLNNLGNTCFMNAALQCVSNTQPLTLYFINNKHLFELNRTNPLSMKGHMAKRYGDLVRDLWSGTSRTIAPVKLRWTIGKYAPRFNGFQQHDSQELLAFLLDGLHEDLNRVQEKPYVELKDSDGRADEEVAKEAWENHVVRNRSIIVDLFHGQLQSTVTCKVCGHISVRFDPFNYLSLPLPMESSVHLEIVLIKLDGGVPWRYGLRLNHGDKYSSLKQQLSDLCHISPQQLLIAEVSNCVIKSLFLDDQKIRITTGGSLLAYEVPLMPEPFVAEEPKTFDQIQRMDLTEDLTIPSCWKSPFLSVNGEAFQASSTALSSIHSQDPENTNCTFKIEDSVSDLVKNQPYRSEGILVAGRPAPSSQNGLPPWHGTGPFLVGGNPASVPSSMSSSLVSISSSVDLTEYSRKNFVVAYHRKVIRQDVYFLSSQKTRPTLFGLPLVLPCYDNTTHQDLYHSVWVQVSRFVSPLPPAESGVRNHAQDCDDSLGYEYPFTLKAVQKDGLFCAWCPWYRFCLGCSVDYCGADFNFASAYIAIDWDPTALHLRYQTSQEKVCLNHSSVQETRRGQTEPISLHDCLDAFTKEEHLGEEEKYYCSKCKQHQLASKKLQIWRLPPVLIIHLKRFQLMNGKWVKSHKIVRFPFFDFDATNYLSSVPREAVLNSCHYSKIEETHANQQTPLQSQSSTNSDFQITNSCVNSSQKDSQQIVTCNRRNSSPIKKKLLNGDLVSKHPLSQDYKDHVAQDFHEHRLKEGYNTLSLKYRLYALVCYNNSNCKEVILDQIDVNSAYILFYEREGIDYNSYLPNVEGMLPDTKDIDDEFESDFRKICCLQ
ncbi:ubiquitin carboxyl-terminal hydrolase 32-like [Limulus polyphemus]|uniref:ubiquitinyl hydrolase 1 n=1 Tax=Limulus polyphemus TaxID=6850 RepID=A0ABM1T584_LIMPO|nr:ubiquitin carboxyl-terminal hydrolase 32-like [Limulus polyphemus]